MSEREPNEAVRIACKAICAGLPSSATLIRENRRGFDASVAVEIVEEVRESDIYALCWEILDRMQDRKVQS